MGPLPFSSGNWLTASWTWWPPIGFNGATAFQQWKLGATTRTGGWRYRFNGATAFPQWKPARSTRGMTDSVTLQWGHCLSAVETRQPEQASRHHDPASMGPLPFSSGNFGNAPLAVCSVTRFNGATAFQQWKLVLLAWPEIVECGFNGATAFQQWKLPHIDWSKEWSKSLQWGHCLSAVETLVGPGGAAGVKLLQWGHCLSAVETAICDPTRTSAMR